MKDMGSKERKKGFYVVVFFPLKKGKKVYVNSISKVHALVHKVGGMFPGIRPTKSELRRTENNKLYFYGKFQDGQFSKKLGYLKCTDLKRLYSFVYESNPENAGSFRSI